MEEVRCFIQNLFLLNFMSTFALVVTTLVSAPSSVPRLLIARQRTFSKYFSRGFKHITVALGIARNSSLGVSLQILHIRVPFPINPTTTTHLKTQKKKRLRK
jgi:hypothetical protein